MGKIDLDKLKVQSFVTSLESSENKTIKGGDYTDDCSVVGCDMTDVQCGGNSHDDSCVHACHTQIADPHCPPTEYC